MKEGFFEGDVEHPPLPVGEVLAPGYTIAGHLHQSNNYDVYDVFSEERACSCIAKARRRDLTDKEAARLALLREGDLLEGLTHPHIARHYETIREPEPVLILETLTGETLAYLIDEGYRRLPLAEVAHLGLHLCSAIHYLHGQGILHLDLKPSNIVSERGMAKILDLSIAQAPGPCRKGAGTVQYMAPEQVRGDHVDASTDVWGIGAVLFEAATAEPPFNAEYEDETASEYTTGSSTGTWTDAKIEDYDQISRRADPVRAHRRVPAIFNTLIARCLDPDPAKRPSLPELTNGLRSLV
ncbi:serine/threonine-protein kinase [Rubrobacter tropicus]|uniref:serine/threonine-protein kinase n=1 Tax=Rubrobacter tropicus TaxID=2653851 RepID=UPI001D18DD6E|nr:serine/threonine-protein kinase [Rubrobacter tropicus]